MATGESRSVNLWTGEYAEVSGDLVDLVRFLLLAGSVGVLVVRPLSPVKSPLSLFNSTITDFHLI